MQLVSQVQPDILIHALFMQHNGKQKLNQIIHSIWGVTGESLFFGGSGFVMFLLRLYSCTSNDSVTPSAWIEVGALIVYVAARLCHQAFVKSIEAIGPNSTSVPTWSWIGWIPFSAIIDVYNLCDTRGKLMLPIIGQVL